MNKINKKLLSCAVFLLAIIPLLVWLMYSNRDKSENGRAIRVGYLPIISSMPLFVAKEQGFFKEAGVEVELVRFESSSHVATAFVSNRIQATASIAASSVMATESRDAGLFRIFVIDAYTPENPISGLIVLASSGISTIQDLKGKRVGTFPGPNSKIVNDIILKNYGMDPAKDVTLVELPPELHIQALLTGQVDALRTTEPIPTQAVVTHNATNIYPGIIEKEVINPFPGGVSIISTAFCHENSDVATKFVLAIYKAIDFIREHPNEANQTLLNYTGIEKRVADAVPTPGFAKASESDGVSLDEFSAIAAKAGLIEKNIDLKPTFFKVGENLLETHHK